MIHRGLLRRGLLHRGSTIPRGRASFPSSATSPRLSSIPRRSPRTPAAACTCSSGPSSGASARRWPARPWAWRELAPGGRYAITIATTARPEARRFVLGIPELDLSAPGSAAAFAAVAAVGALPYASFLPLAALFITGLAVLIGRAVLDGTRAWRWLTATPARSTLASLGAAICLQ